MIPLYHTYGTEFQTHRFRKIIDGALIRMVRNHSSAVSSNYH